MKAGFSLVELMVVVAIVAILAAAATPVYRDYVYNAKMNSVVEYALSSIQKIAIEYSSKGQLPTEFNGAALQSTSSTTTAVTGVPYASTILYNAHPGWSAYGRAAAFHVDVDTELGQYIDGYVENASNSRLTVGFVEDDNGVITFHCGVWNDLGTRSLPLESLPPGCTEPQVRNYLNP